jgi:hypothetical protein
MDASNDEDGLQNLVSVEHNQELLSGAGPRGGESTIAPLLAVGSANFPGGVPRNAVNSSCDFRL